MNKWIPIDNYHQKPKEFQEVILTDSNHIYYEMVWLNFCSKTPCAEGWYKIDGTEPLNIKPTHWMVLQLP